MQAFYSPQFVLPLPPGHRFPMGKYAMLHQRLMAEMPTVRLPEAMPATDGELALVHTPAYIDNVATGSITPAAMREIGFPWSEGMVQRARRSVGGTIAAVRTALQEGVAANMAGGTHHSHANKGSGFCVFNDVAVSARLAQAEWGRSAEAMDGQVARRKQLQVAVIDLDVHQGNGTAHIFKDDASVFTLSLHGEKNFPFRKEASDLDVPLPDGCADADYLKALDSALHQLADRFNPGLVIYLAGADPFEGDRLGRLKLTYAGLQARDARVFDWCWQRRIPLAFCMGGGYGVDLTHTVQVQVNTFATGLRYWGQWQQWQNPSP